MTSHTSRIWTTSLSKQIARSQQQIRILSIDDATIEAHQQFIDLAQRVMALLYRDESLLEVIARLERYTLQMPSSQSHISEQIMLALRLNSPDLLTSPTPVTPEL
ncbi:hypothetical protein IQ266_07250 [filamentous cyanobacterium LEGE 11480]|uniref:Uncharacterized protein n=1 Tax=Romeriopsis navalis LEGE 11480 TaxID=2777977 RepID=A0A928VJ53_9CYAN|nr:hypothetical protein [Romeriopsis navalis]MBE9029556.1 hypothetical protein [Romeriopsis navalis LEGE 11480]